MFFFLFYKPCILFCLCSLFLSYVRADRCPGGGFGSRVDLRNIIDPFRCSVVAMREIIL